MFHARWVWNLGRGEDETEQKIAKLLARLSIIVSTYRIICYDMIAVVNGKQQNFILQFLYLHLLPFLAINTSPHFITNSESGNNRS